MSAAMHIPTLSSRRPDIAGRHRLSRVQRSYLPEFRRIAARARRRGQPSEMSFSVRAHRAIWNTTAPASTASSRSAPICCAARSAHGSRHLRFNREAPWLMEEPGSAGLDGRLSGRTGHIRHTFVTTISFRWAPRSGLAARGRCSIFRRVFRSVPAQPRHAHRRRPARLARHRAAARRATSSD